MEDKIVELLGSIQAAAVNVAPAVWKALLVRATIDSCLSLAFAASSVIGFLLWVRYAKALWATDEDPKMFAAFLGSAVLGVCVIIGLIVLFSANTWLGLFYPEAVVITDLIHTVKK